MVDLENPQIANDMIAEMVDPRWLACEKKQQSKWCLDGSQGPKDPLQRIHLFVVIGKPQKPDTPPKTNMEPENGPLEKEIPIGNHHFQVPC